MHRIKISVLAMFAILPAFADARLPAVNYGAAGVSARAAFGEPDLTINRTTDANNYKYETRIVTPRADNVVARVADTGIDMGALSADVLTPLRPSSDLWATSDAPLRMPTADEFRTFATAPTNYQLPEESLDIPTSGARVAYADAPATVANAPMSELDAQIARLNDLQRRADDAARNVAAARPTRVIAAPIASQPVAATTTRVATTATTTAPSTQNAPEYKLSRMVVPMDTPDAVVRAVEKNTSPRVSAVREDMTKMTPSELRRAFRKTFMSENKHLSTFQIDDRFDVASDMSSAMEGFTSRRDLSEEGGIRPLEIKIRFRNDDSALSRENYNLLTEYASIVVSNPKRAIQVAIPARATIDNDDRKLAARRLAIVEQVLRDTGVAEQRIMPVLSQRDEEGFVLRIISSDQFETISQQNKNIFGDTVSKKTYKSMSW